VWSFNQLETLTGPLPLNDDRDHPCGFRENLLGLVENLVFLAEL